MDRRSFLTAMFGIAGAAALAGAIRPTEAVAGVPGAGNGILDEIEASQTEAFDDGTHAEVQPVDHRRWDRDWDRDRDRDWDRGWRRRRHGRRWRRVCRSYWRHGRRRVRCYRRRGPSVILRF
ncbi:MAG: protamine-2 (modular protein) [Mesorhizobium sp.]|nr:MAG: protamine-2 (modular protein) [Mesorhizobium sp.]RWQ22103.1 MAG: protamine-2 (modular protein) [Mesorhizobium sp.]TIM23248.1 MAG: protamine-2 (modular protein) [Mesorhizobium sp.]TIN68503.1 MAG: protamine-2 (modular protein) [Mesorhizobium sp.]